MVPHFTQICRYTGCYSCSDTTVELLSCWFSV